MTVLIFTSIVFVGALLAGMLGALTGLGGGVIIIPLLTLVLGVDIHYAVGASLIAVIATSTGSAGSYVKRGITNIRIGILLEVATTISAIAGAVIAVYINPGFIAILFGVILLFSAFMMLRHRIEGEARSSTDSVAAYLKLNSSYPMENGQMKFYTVHNVVGGFSMMFIAGIVSGLLGIGSGALKVLALDNIMKLPFKVSTTTSNFMMGVTAAASAMVYLHRGQIEPGIAMPVGLGVLLGAKAGAGILLRSKTERLKLVFAGIIVLLAVQMIYSGYSGNFTSGK